jgi:redox-sensitive bicupin YhaK (pirin superfamily)
LPGEPACFVEDDDPRYQDIPSTAIPEIQKMTERKRGSSAASSGANAVPSKALRQTRATLTFRCRRKLRRIKIDDAECLCYVFAGAGTFRDASNPQKPCANGVGGRSRMLRQVRRENHSLVLFDRGDEIVVQAGPEGIRFLLVSGKPLEEPVAWYGPIVMNTQAELNQAMRELQDGSFIRHK